MGSSPEIPGANLERFRAALEKSGLVAPSRLQDIPASTTESAEEYAAALVEGGFLTQFQASKLLSGQWQGLIFGPFRILSPLGKGGIGVVYLAREVPSPEKPDADNFLQAIKILPPSRAARQMRTKARFEREMELGKVIPPHPHMARAYSSGDIGGVLYIAMEYVPGRTLRNVIANDGPMQVGQAALVFSQIAEALGTAHAAGFIHRDIKPANIMILPDGNAKLLDFGFAIRAGERWEADPMIIGGEGYVLGTMDYIAPEQTEDAANISAASDQYALGCSLYFAITGRPPFPGGSAIQKIKSHRSHKPKSLRSLRPDLPREWIDVIKRLMAKRPEDRFPTAFHVAEMLRLWATLPAPKSMMVKSVGEDPEDNATSQIVEIETRSLSNIDIDDPPLPTVKPPLLLTPPPSSPGFSLSQFPHELTLPLTRDQIIVVLTILLLASFVLGFLSRMLLD